MSHWPALAATIGLPKASEWQPEILSLRDDERVSRIVLRMALPGHDPLVLKHEERPRDTARAEARMRDYRARQSLFSASAGPGQHLPAILAVSPDSQTCVMEMFDGLQLTHRLDLIGNDPAGRVAVLAQAGAWIGAFHRSGTVGQRAFWPKPARMRLDRVRDQIRTGTREVAWRGRFLASLRHLRGLDADVRGQEVTTVDLHGDLHLRNLLVGAQGIAGIDMSPARHGPAALDLARLLVDVACRHGRDAAAGALLAEPEMTALLDAYGMPVARPVLDFLCRVRLLTDWANLPATREARSLAEQRRLEGIMTLQKRLFA
ncbi:MAG: phosphotransferase [Celeribacter sp.]